MDSPATLPAGEFVDYIRRSGYDHLDFGCGVGGSLEYARQTLQGVKGLGIDCSTAKVEEARQAGFDALVYDIHEIPDTESVRFVVLSHFLEHIPNSADVRAFIRKACTIATDFVLIKQPYFDADGMLFQRGLKLYWSDWKCHPNRMTSLELDVIVRALKSEGLPLTHSIGAKGAIVSSGDRRVHPLNSPAGQSVYEQGLHPAKPMNIAFDFPVYVETWCLITKMGTPHQPLLERLNFDRLLRDESDQVPGGAAFATGLRRLAAIVDRVAMRSRRWKWNVAKHSPRSKRVA